MPGAAELPSLPACGWDRRVVIVMDAWMCAGCPRFAGSPRMFTRLTASAQLRAERRAFSREVVRRRLWLVTVHHLTPAHARRIAVQAQLLDAARPPDLLTMFDRLTFVRSDPVAAVAPNVDLVAWSRLGDAFDRDDLVRALVEERSLWEHDGFVRPMADLSLFAADMATWPTREYTRDWLDDNADFAADVVAKLGSDGPLRSKDIDDTAKRPWTSSGWNNNRNVTIMLECLARQGDVAIAERQGRTPLWDLAERVHPDNIEVVPTDQAKRRREERRLHALGIARTSGTLLPGEPNLVDDQIGEPATIDGVEGTWRVDPTYLDSAADDFVGRTALVSPLDQLVFDRARIQDLFDFEYVLEMYKPAAKRKWGYFALPILHGDRLIGKLDAKSDHKKGQFNVWAVHEDEPFNAATTRAVRAEIKALAEWLGLKLIHH